MKLLLLFLALAVVDVHSAFEPNLRVRFGLGIPGLNIMMEMPGNATEAIKQGWTKRDPPPGSLASLDLFCEDETFCIFYDYNGVLSGLQISVAESEIVRTAFGFEEQGFISWEPTSAAGESKKYWSTQQYFVSAAYLQQDPAERINYNSPQILKEGAVWVRGSNGVLDRISSRSSDIENSVFTRQACIPGMGRHYYYNTTKSTPCRADTLYPWFTLLHSGELVGTGLVIFGNISPQSSNKRVWFENSGSLTSRVILPNASECLYDLASDPGRTTLHIYYIDKPWLLGCLKN